MDILKEITGTVLIILIVLFIIQVLFIALFQMLGGKYIAKVEKAGYGNSLLIALLSLLWGYVLEILFIVLNILSLKESFLGAVLIINIFIILALIFYSKLFWHIDYGKAAKASIINIVIGLISGIGIYAAVANQLNQLLKLFK